MFNNIIRYLKGLVTKTKKSLTIYKALIYQTSQIDPNRFDNVYNPLYSVIIVNSLFPNIIVYNDALKLFMNRMPVNEYIPVYTIPSDYNAVSLRSWYIINNTYINPVETTKNFILLAREFIELYEYYSELQDIKFIQRKNLNTYTPIINNLFTLLGELKDV